MIRCDCGYVVTGETEDELVADAQRHARERHGMDVPREHLVAVARRGEAGAGASSEVE